MKVSKVKKASKDGTSIFYKYMKVFNIITALIGLIFIANLFTKQPILFKSYESLSNAYQYYFTFVFAILLLFFLCMHSVTSFRYIIIDSMILNEGLCVSFLLGTFVRNMLFDSLILLINPICFSILVLFIIINTTITIYVQGFMAKTVGERKHKLLQAFSWFPLAPSFYLVFSFIKILRHVPFFKLPVVMISFIVHGAITAFLGIFLNIRIGWLEKEFSKSLAISLVFWGIFLMIYFLIELIFFELIFFIDILEFIWQCLIIGTILYSIIISSTIVLNEIRVLTGGILWGIANLPALLFFYSLVLDYYGFGCAKIISVIRDNVKYILPGVWSIISAFLSTIILRFILTKKNKKIKRSINDVDFDVLVNTISIDKKTAQKIIEKRPFRSWDEVENIKGIGKKRLRYLKDNFRIE